ncbi:polysaccharide deacetylase family protein [Roseateles sp. GG27B]
MILRMLFSKLSPGGNEARLSILIFHRVLPEPDPLFPGEISAQKFDQICNWLVAWFTVLPLDEAIIRLKNNDLPQRALAITFDDGYADNHDVALPVLKRHGLSATFYVATGFLDGGRMWNDSVIESFRTSTFPVIELAGTVAAALGEIKLGDIPKRRSAINAAIGAIKYLDPNERLDWVNAITERAGVILPNNLMMSSAQVCGLRDAGMQIGAHTVSHPILAKLTRSVAQREIADSKHALEALLGDPVSLFAYPNGKLNDDFSPESVQIVRELGFCSAVSTTWGAARPATDLFQLPRFTPWDRSRLRFGIRLARNLISS